MSMERLRYTARHSPSAEDLGCRIEVYKKGFQLRYPVVLSVLEEQTDFS